MQTATETPAPTQTTSYRGKNLNTEARRKGGQAAANSNPRGPGGKFQKKNQASTSNGGGSLL